MMRYWIAADIETRPDDGAVPYLAPIVANRSLRDTAKIDADLDAKAKAQRDKMGLDPWASRPEVITVQTEADPEPSVFVCTDDEGLRAALLAIHGLRVQGMNTRPFLGYRVRTFDLPHLTHHARRLGLEWPRLDLRRYNSWDCVDLYDVLADDDCEHVISRSLKSACRIYGIDVPEDDIDGKDVAALLAEGNLEAVAAHCRRDVERVVRLARRCRLIADPAEPSMATATRKWLETRWQEAVL